MAGQYRGYSSTSRRRAPWWQRFPRPVEKTALRLWSALPMFVRRPLIPLGALFGEHTVTADSRTVSSADVVPGVFELRQDGFTPVEEHTGALWVGEVWPEAHRRSVPEARPDWLDFSDSPLVWLVRSPWTALSLDDVFMMMWPWVERDRTHDEAVYRSRVAELLSWDEQRALEWHAEWPSL